MAKKKPDEETSLQVKDLDAAPSYLAQTAEDQVVEGLENMRPQDLLIPRLMLMQALSPTVVDGTNKAGQIVNSISGATLIEKDEAAVFVPIYHYLEWIKWADRETGEGIQERSIDPQGTLAQQAMRQVKHTNSQGQSVFTVTEYHNFVCIFPVLAPKIPLIISCCKTNLKHARKLLGLVRLRGRFPLYAGKYSVKAVIESNRKNQKYYVFNFQNEGWIAKEMLEPMRNLYEMIRDAHKNQKLMAHQIEQQQKEIEEETEI